MQTALADGVRADADVLLDLVGVGELRRASVQLLGAEKQTNGQTLNAVLDTSCSFFYCSHETSPLIVGGP